MSLLLWGLISLVAISLIGDHAYAALGVTVLGGVAFGLNAYLDHRASAFREEASSRERGAGRLLNAVIRYGWLLDVGATLLLIFPSRWMAAGFLLVLISWFLRWWAYRRAIGRTGFDVPILALIVMVSVSLWASADLSLSMVPLGQIVAGVNAFYSIVEHVRTADEVAQATVGLAGLGLLIALAAPFAVEWNSSKLFVLPQIYSHFRQVLPAAVNGNVLAGALTIIIPIDATVLFYAPLGFLAVRLRRWTRVLLTLSLVAMGAVMLLTQSRGGITAVGIELLLLAAVRFPWVFALPVVGLGGLIAFAARLNVPQLVDVFFSADAISGLAGREEVWSRAIYMLQDVPYTGIGLGIFPRALQVLYPLFLVGPDVVVPHAHNLFLQVGVDLGIPGLMAYLAILTLGLVSAAHMYRRARASGNGELSAIALGLGFALIGMCLHGLVDSVTWDAKPSVFAWCLWGLIAVAQRQICHATRGGKRIVTLLSEKTIAKANKS